MTKFDAGPQNLTGLLLVKFGEHIRVIRVWIRFWIIENGIIADNIAFNLQKNIWAENYKISNDILLTIFAKLIRLCNLKFYIWKVEIKIWILIFYSNMIATMLIFYTNILVKFVRKFLERPWTYTNSGHYDFFNSFWINEQKSWILICNMNMLVKFDIGGPQTRA